MERVAFGLEAAEEGEQPYAAQVHCERYGCLADVECASKELHFNRYRNVYIIFQSLISYIYIYRYTNQNMYI